MNRPVAHFTPRSGWVNDPYGVRWDGSRYHLYFQALPDRTDWAPECSWGHAVSPDLVRWEERPVVLRPAPDEVGCWSGCVVTDDAGRLLAFYTSVGSHDLERGAVAVVELDEDGGAVRAGRRVLIDGPPADLRAVAFRDPFVRRDGAGWAMVVGGGLPDGSGCVLTYRSDDLCSWQYAGLLCAGRVAAAPGRQVWECPQLLVIDGWEVLVVSVQVDGAGGPVVASARVAGQPFARWQRLVHGAVGYASSLFRDRDDRPAVISWLREAEPGQASRSWAGAESLVGTVGVAASGAVLVGAHPAAIRSRLFAQLPLPGPPAEVATGPWLAESPAGAPVDVRIGGDRFRATTSPDRATLTVACGGRVDRLPVRDPEAGLQVFGDADLVELFWGGSYGAWRLPG